MLYGIIKLCSYLDSLSLARPFVPARVFGGMNDWSYKFIAGFIILLGLFSYYVGTEYLESIEAMPPDEYLAAIIGKPVN